MPYNRHIHHDRSQCNCQYQCQPLPTPTPTPTPTSTPTLTLRGCQASLTLDLESCLLCGTLLTGNRRDTSEDWFLSQHIVRVPALLNYCHLHFPLLCFAFEFEVLRSRTLSVQFKVECFGVHVICATACCKHTTHLRATIVQPFPGISRMHTFPRVW